MPETFTRFDAADYLEDERDVVAFLDEATKDGTPEEIALAQETAARARRRWGG